MPKSRNRKLRRDFQPEYFPLYKPNKRGKKVIHKAKKPIIAKTLLTIGNIIII